MAKLFVCRACGYHGKPKKITKGSIWLEIALWICFLFPGIIYTVWRLTSKYKACPLCKSAEIIPEDSPVGKQLLSKADGGASPSA